MGYNNPYYQPNNYSYQGEPLIRGVEGTTLPNIVGSGLNITQGLTSNIDQLKAIDQISTSAPSQQTDYTGKPMYNLGQFSIDAMSIDPKAEDATVGSSLGAAGRGAAAGAILGPAGAVIGAGVSVIGHKLFARARRRKLERKKAQMLGNLQSAQNTYNQNTLAYNKEQTRMQDYNNSLNRNNRMYNLYNRNNIYG